MLKLTTTILRGRATTFMSFLFVCVINLNSYSQLSSPLSNPIQLAEYLGDSRFNQLHQSNPSYLEFLDERCSNGYTVIDMPLEKTEGMTVLNTIPALKWIVIESEGKNVDQMISSSVTAEEFVLNHSQIDFNFLRYELAFEKSENTYYVLGNTGKVLIVYSVDHVSQKLNSNL